MLGVRFLCVLRIVKQANGIGYVLPSDLLPLCSSICKKVPHCVFMQRKCSSNAVFFFFFLGRLQDLKGNCSD